jgi:hypothetical protein
VGGREEWRRIVSEIKAHPELISEKKNNYWYGSLIQLGS